MVHSTSVSHMSNFNLTNCYINVNEQPMKVMKKDGFYELIGKKNFHENIVSALDYAETLVK